jgi:hypothetical protein
MSTPLHSLANKAVHSNAFAKALADELARCPVPGLTDPVAATPEDSDIAILTGTTEPLTVQLGDIFAFLTTP